MPNEINLLIAPYGMDETGQANVPNPTQSRVLEWVDKVRATPLKDFDHIPVLYLQGGNGAGKTRALMAPAIEILTQIAGIRILWGREDFKDLKLSVMDKFFEVLPYELLAGKNETYHYYDIRTNRKGAGRIYFNGLKDLSGLGSQEFAIIIITEAHEITEQTYRTLKRRCRQAGVPCMILMESEPPNETHWLADLTDPTKENYDSDIEKIELSTYENWENLSPAYKGSLESMPEAAKRKYILGKTGFSVAGKPYYQGFKHNLHTGEFEHIEGRELLVGWDFGFHFPAVLITQIDLRDRWLWLREMLGRDITIDKFADHVINQLNTLYPGCRCVHLGDPAARQRSDKSELTSADILRAKGINLLSRQSTYRQRKEIIETRLSRLSGEKPMLMVDKRHCKIVIDAFLGGYHYPERREAQQFEGKFEMPYKDGFYEHLMNAGEYIAVNVFSATEPTNKQMYEALTGLKKQEFAQSEYAVLAY
jgi:phage terminase large subunit